jgi:hypothetical protein
MRKQQLVNKFNNLKNIITNQDVQPNKLEYAWQEWDKQKIILENKCIEIDNKLEILLKQITDTDLANRIRSIVAARECTNSYVWYKRGLFEGVKYALILNNKKIGDTAKNGL